MEIKDISKYTNQSSFLWVVANINLPKNAKWSFSKRLWQIPIINDLSKEIVVQKPAQVGLSTIMSAKMLYLGYHIPMRIMYSLPREKDLKDLVPTRFNPMIDNSPIIQEVAGNLDSVRRKQIGDTYIHFVEASTEPRALDVDMLINDEVNLSDQNVLDQFAYRIAASPYKIRYQLGTPTVPYFGISDLIENSDWKLWHVQCPYCGKWTVFNENWTSILKVTKHRIYYGGNCCDKCKDIGYSPDDIADGKWVAQNPNNPVSGYQVVRTMDATTSAQELYVMWKKTRNERNFHNFGLGVPYISGGIDLSKESVLHECVDSDLEKEEFGNKSNKYYVGIDQGNILHLVILREGEDEILELVYADVIDDKGGNPFHKVEKIINRYPKANIVTDLLPNRHSALGLVKNRKNAWGATFQGRIKSDSSFYSLSKSDDNLVSIQKNDSLDELVTQYVKTGKLRFYTDNGQTDVVVEEIAEHLANLQRTTKTRQLFNIGEQTFSIWESVGPDHYAMALVYALTAFNIMRKGEYDDLLWAFLG